MSKHKVNGAFVMHSIAMIKSPAWRALSPATRVLLDRLEIEHAAHGGNENGRLQVSYDQFADYGVRRPSVAGAKREAVALGFVAVAVGTSTRDGQIRPPNVYRVTYLPTPDADPTDDWRKITSLKQASALQALAQRPRRRKRQPPRSCPVRVNAEGA